MRPTLIATTALLVVMSGAAGAQSNIEGRVGKLESEMRAVQRKVFPQGAGRYFQPEVEAEPAGPAQTGVPATSALADLTARVSALETQLTSLTGQVEQAGFRTRQVQEQFEAYRRATDARLKALEGTGTTPAPAAASLDEDAPTPAVRPVVRPASTPPRPPATPARADADETPAATTAVTRPNTGDAAEDAYLYGYRLWAAKRYPEAQAALKKAAADHPKSRRYSYAQNLLGRAYLDDGKPSLASMAFYDNYKKMPDGERAPESLFYLATALQRLNKPADACKVYDELTDVYAAKIGAKMKADIAAGRAAAKCKAA
jgi:TolA-binding protein